MKNREIPRSYYDEVKNAIYWGEILPKLGIRLKKVNRAGLTSRIWNYRCKCIFHKEKTASLTFFDKTGTFHCYGCGESGDIFYFISRYLTDNKRSLPRVCRWLKKCFNIPLPW
ncbi:MAG: CHC2 zinc finger domain-containing protein [Parcubacteria group bacterium]|jgi:DNA primase